MQTKRCECLRIRYESSKSAIQDSLASKVTQRNIGFAAHALCSRFIRKALAIIRKIRNGIRKYS